MAKLILMRHGESIWNQKNLFTGWVDVPLSQKGICEAEEAGRAIQNLPIDIIFTSRLIRADQTWSIAMAFHHSHKVPVVQHEGEGKLEEWGTIYGEKAKLNIIPVYRAWQLNERMYGELQGLDKDETRAKFGVEQVQIWRRSFDVAPPKGESLKICHDRTIPYFNEVILPHLKKGRNVLITAHGNSLRSIVMDLDKLSEEEVVNLEMTLGKPVIYQFEDGKFKNESI